MKTKYYISFVMAGLLLVGCGENASVNSAYAQSKTSLEGNVADGYLIGAKVCIDENENLACDVGELSTITTDKGFYSFSDINESSYPIVVEVTADTIDSDTNKTVDKAYVLSAPAGRGGFISPLTSMVNEYMLSYADDNITLLDARDLIAKSLGFNSIEDLFTNYMEKPSNDINLTKEQKEIEHAKRDEIHAIAKLMVYTKNELKNLVSQTIEQSGTQYDAQDLKNDHTSINLIASARMVDMLPNFGSEVSNLVIGDEESFKHRGEMFANNSGVEDSHKDDFKEKVKKAKQHKEKVDKKNGVSGQVSTGSLQN